MKSVKIHLGHFHERQRAELLARIDTGVMGTVGMEVGDHVSDEAGDLFWEQLRFQRESRLHAVRVDIQEIRYEIR